MAWHGMQFAKVGRLVNPQLTCSERFSMRRSSTRSLWFALTACAAAMVSTAAVAAPVTHYSEAFINSLQSVNDTTPDRVRDLNGGLVQSQNSGSTTFGFSGFSQTVSSNTSATANLGTGQLRAAATLGLGTIQGGTPPAYGTDATRATARAEFADQFQLFSGNTPYLWQANTQVTFNFGVTGFTSIPNLPQPLNSGRNIVADLKLYTMKVGTLDLMAQLSTQTTWNSALANQIQANQIGFAGWCLGNYLAPTGWCDGSWLQPVSLNNGAASINHTFQPGSDFEWILALETRVNLDTSLQNISATLDFGNTVNTSFQAPAGATVYSASGLFPNTLALSDVPGQQVPEQNSIALLALGLVAVGAQHKRKRKSTRMHT
jgi:hypothetical protein